jgi:hypothetical protein
MDCGAHCLRCMADAGDPQCNEEIPKIEASEQLRDDRGANERNGLSTTGSRLYSRQNGDPAERYNALPELGFWTAPLHCPLLLKHELLR